MFGLGILDAIKLGAGFVVGALVAGTVAYNVGYWRGDDFGYERAQNEARERAMALIEKRSKDNEEINDLDAAGLCTELGGEWMSDERRCN